MCTSLWNRVLVRTLLNPSARSSARVAAYNIPQSTSDHLACPQLASSFPWCCLLVILSPTNFILILAVSSHLQWVLCRAKSLISSSKLHYPVPNPAITGMNKVIVMLQQYHWIWFLLSLLLVLYIYIHTHLLSNLNSLLTGMWNPSQSWINLRQKGCDVLLCSLGSPQGD